MGQGTINWRTEQAAEAYTNACLWQGLKVVRDGCKTVFTFDEDTMAERWHEDRIARATVLVYNINGGAVLEHRKGARMRAIEQIERWDNWEFETVNYY